MIEARTAGLPVPPAPAGPYESVLIRGPFGAVSGQFPLEAGRLRWSGRVGESCPPKQARKAARLAARNLLAQISTATDGFASLVGLIRLEGYVAVTSDDIDIVTILDAASETIHDLLGERGRHTRTAVPVDGLPLQAPIELAALFIVDQ